MNLRDIASNIGNFLGGVGNGINNFINPIHSPIPQTQPPIQPQQPISYQFWHSPIGQGLVNTQQSLANAQRFIQSPQSFSNLIPQVKPFNQNTIPGKVGNAGVNLSLQTLGNFLSAPADVGSDIGSILTSSVTNQPVQYGQLKSPITRTAYNLASNIAPQRVPATKLGINNTPEEILGNIGGSSALALLYSIPSTTKTLAGNIIKQAAKENAIGVIKKGAVEGFKNMGLYGLLQGLSDNRQVPMPQQIIKSIAQGFESGAIGSVLGSGTALTGYVFGKGLQALKKIKPQITDQEAIKKVGDYFRYTASGRFAEKPNTGTFQWKKNVLIGSEADKKEMLAYRQWKKEMGIPEFNQQGGFVDLNAKIGGKPPVEGGVSITKEYKQLSPDVFNEQEGNVFGKVVKKNGKEIGVVAFEPNYEPNGVGYIQGIETTQGGKGYGKEIINKLFSDNPNIKVINGTYTDTSKGFWEKLGAKLGEDKSFTLSRPSIVEGGVGALELLKQKAIKDKTWNKFGDELTIKEGDLIRKVAGKQPWDWFNEVNNIKTKSNLSGLDKAVSKSVNDMNDIGIETLSSAGGKDHISLPDISYVTVGTKTLTPEQIQAVKRSGLAEVKDFYNPKLFNKQITGKGEAINQELNKGNVTSFVFDQRGMTEAQITKRWNDIVGILKSPPVKGGVEGGVNMETVNFIREQLPNVKIKENTIDKIISSPNRDSAFAYHNKGGEIWSMYWSGVREAGETPKQARSILIEALSPSKSLPPPVEGGVGGVKVQNNQTIPVSPSVEQLTTSKLKTPIQSTELPQVSGGGQGNLPSSPSSGNIIDPVQKIINALNEAKPLRGKQEQIYAKIRSGQAGAIAGIGKNIPGEKGFFAQLGQLKGSMPKVSFESVRKQLDQPTIDSLFNKVEQSNLSPFEKITTKGGLAKLLGAEGGAVPTKGELGLLHEVFGPEFTQAVLDKRPIMEKIMSNVTDALNIPRSLMASFDMSAPLRQGAFLIGRPKQWIPAFGNMVKYFFNENSYKGLLDNIKQRPTYQLMREGRLALTDVSPLLNQREESFMSNIVDKIPGIGSVTKASNRAYSGFLNKLRADVFDDLLKSAQNQGIDPKTIVPDLAKFVNSATGRGDLGSLNRAAVALNGVFFSPRLLASRLNLMNPTYYMSLNPFVRKEALKSLATFAGTALATLTLAKMGGASVGADPRSADFGKIKFGNTRYDILAGFQQPIRLMAQLISGKIISTTTGKEITLGEGYKPMTRLDILGNFFKSKESPVAGFATGLLQGTTAIGQPFDLAPEIVQRFIPMVIQDMYDLAKDRGSPLASLLGIPGMFGVGVQTYGKQIPNIKVSPTGKASVKLSPLPGLPEDIVSKFTGQQQSNVPLNQQQSLANTIQAQNQKKVDMDKIKQQAEAGNLQPQGNYLPVIVDGQVKVIDTSFKPTPPNLTGNTELDKRLVSKFNTQISQKANDILDLYNAGKLTGTDAEQQLKDLQTLKNNYATPKKPKKTTIKISKPKIAKLNLKLSKPKKITAKKMKLPKIKEPKKVKIVLTKK